MEPRISKRERKLHLGYELPHRIHCSRIYPVTAPNGSTVILFGHDRGLRVLWRGGRRLKEQTTTTSSPLQTNGVGKGKDVEVIVIDSDDDEPKQDPPNEVEDQYEEHEEDQDPECPYPSVIQDLDMNLQSQVLHMAIPSISSSGTSRTPELAKTHIIVALGCADGRIVLMTLPLRPPRSAQRQEFFENEVSELHLEGKSSVSHSLAVKVVPTDEQSSPGQHRQDKNTPDSDGRVLVAAVASSVDIWSLSMTPESIIQSPTSLRPLVHATVPGHTVSYQASSRFSQLLLGDRSGAVRIYDLFTARTTDQRPSSRDSALVAPVANEEIGKWIMSYHTPFHSPKDGLALARRKNILDAAWVLGGRAVLALLEDGEWGLWDLTGPSQTGKSVEEFAVHGYLGSSSASEVADTRKQKRGGPKLAPMTPNTRKSKAEKLFSGTPKPPGVAATGGISVNSVSGRSGQFDESVVIWYGSDIYSINSMQTFWQRSSTSSSSGFGSLYTPGLTHISDINLMNENITSISQFPPTTTTTVLGQMNTQRDLLVSAEHRFIILQNLRPPAPVISTLQQATERPASRDQRILDAGELDLGGMDRMLDSMAGIERARRVGFAG